MTTKFMGRTWHKITVGVFFSLIAVVLILGFYFDEHWSPILNKKVHDAVLKSTDSLYNVSFSSAEFHLFQGKVVIFNAEVKPDTAVYSRLRKLGLAPNNLLEVRVKKIVLNNIHPFKLYFDRVIDIRQIVLTAPEVHISYQLNHTKDTTIKDNRTAWQKISKTFHSVHVQDIFLNDVKFRYDDLSGHKMEVSSLKEMDVHANELLIDQGTQKDSSRFLFCKDIVTEVNNYTGKTTDGLYNYTVKHLMLSTFSSQMNAEGITLDPARPASFFNQTVNDRYSLQIDSVQLDRFDFLNYHKYRKFLAANIIIHNGKFALYKNPNRQSNNTDKIRSFPNVALSLIKDDIKVDTISAKHINISYSEFNTKSKETGTIEFNNTEGQFLNVTNDKEALQKDHITLVNVTSHFLGRARIDLHLTFDLADKDAAYTYKGTVGPMDLKVANPTIMPLAMVKINDGKLKQLSFDFKANSREAHGKVTLLYNDLKVSVLKPDTTNDRLKKQQIASLYANIFILKHDNPDKDGEEPRSFNVNFTREPPMPFFKYTWQSLLAGIKPSVGYDKKTQEATKALATQSIIKKQDRQIRKAERKEKRADRKEKRAQKKLQKQLDKEDQKQ